MTYDEAYDVLYWAGVHTDLIDDVLEQLGWSKP